MITKVEIFSPQPDAPTLPLGGSMVSKLHKLKVEERPKRINPDTVLVVAANILGIVWITQHERFHPITTKSLGFVLKPTR